MRLAQEKLLPNKKSRHIYRIDKRKKEGSIGRCFDTWSVLLNEALCAEVQFSRDEAVQRFR